MIQLGKQNFLVQMQICHLALSHSPHLVLSNLEVRECAPENLQSGDRPFLVFICVNFIDWSRDFEKVSAVTDRRVDSRTASIPPSSHSNPTFECEVSFLRDKTDPCREKYLSSFFRKFNEFPTDLWYDFLSTLIPRIVQSI